MLCRSATEVPNPLGFLFSPSSALERSFSNVRSLRSVQCHSLSGHRRRSGRTSSTRMYFRSVLQSPLFPLSVSLSLSLILFPSSSLFCPAFGIRRRSSFADARRNLTRSPPMLCVSLLELLVTVPLVCTLANAICPIVGKASRLRSSLNPTDTPIENCCANYARVIRFISHIRLAEYLSR